MRVVLPSNASMKNYPDNSLTKFTVQLSQPLNLSEGRWEFGLDEIQFFKSWYNVVDATLFVKKGAEETRIQLEDGFYNSPELFIKYLNDNIKTRCHNETSKHITFKYNEVKRCCNLSVTPHKGLSFEMSPNLRYLLGYNNVDINTELQNMSQRYPSRGDTASPPVTILGKQSMKVNTIFNLMVYCDIAQSTPVGDTEAPLLRAVPVIGKHWENQCTTFSKIQYVPVSQKLVRSISVYIYTDYGQPVPFTAGRTVVTLQFRRSLQPHL